MVTTAATTATVDPVTAMNASRRSLRRPASPHSDDAVSNWDASITTLCCLLHSDPSAAFYTQSHCHCRKGDWISTALRQHWFQHKKWSVVNPWSVGM